MTLCCRLAPVRDAVLSSVAPIRGIETEQIMTAYDAVGGVDSGSRAFVRERYRI